MPRRHPLRPVISTVFATLFTALLLLAGGCAPLEWHHGGGGEHNVDRDQEQCLTQARLEALQRIPLRPPVPRIVVDQHGRSVVVHNTPQHPDPERFSLEQSLLQQCMKARGYTLEPKSPKPE
jgi:hypothetical protein